MAEKGSPPDNEAIALDESDALERAWLEKPNIIRAFTERRPQYEQLCSEIEYILTKRLNEAAIEYSAVTKRAKSLKSFAEKLTRKSYENPLTDITDFAGVRVVYLYKSDRAAIEKIIESEFEVVERVDKVEEQETDRFGYGALHYLVYIGRKSSGARYDDLKGLVCEIQVRTVLQDAWAIVDHHLVYKQETAVPTAIRRKLNSLSGLFETADDQFDNLRNEREDYKEKIKGKRNNRRQFLSQELNVDTLAEYLSWRDPELSIAGINDLNLMLGDLTDCGLRTLDDVEALLNRNEKGLSFIKGKIRITTILSPIIRSLALENSVFRDTRIGPELRKVIEEYLQSVEEKDA